VQAFLLSDYVVKTLNIGSCFNCQALNAALHRMSYFVNHVDSSYCSGNLSKTSFAINVHHR